MMRNSRRRTASGGRTSREFTGSRSDWVKRLPRIQFAQVLRGALFVAIVAVLAALYPPRERHEYDAFQVGAIAPFEVIAPERFQIRKSRDEYLEEVEAARRAVPPVLELNGDLAQSRIQALGSLIGALPALRTTAVTDSVLQGLRRSFPELGAVTEATTRFLLAQGARASGKLKRIEQTVDTLLVMAYAPGIVASKSDVFREGEAELTHVSQGSEERLPVSGILDIDEFTLTLQEEIGGLIPQGTSADVKAVYELVVAFLTPNLRFDTLETEHRRAEAAAGVSLTKGTVLKDELIIERHRRVTPEHIDKLNSLAAHMNARREEGPYIGLIQVGAQAVISGLMVTIFFAFLAISRPSVFRQTSNIVLFGIVLVMPALVASYAAADASVTPYLVPVALSAMLATVLFDAEIGLVVSLVAAALCSSVLGSLQQGLVFLVAGIVGSYSTRQVLHRSDFYRSILYLIVAYTLTISATCVLLVNYTTVPDFVQKVRWDLVIGIFTACASSVLTIGLLPIFESVFGVVTPITLLELSDLNRPLLRNLAIRAPGTYSHSIIMASLSEAAADAIGADRLLVRVGCYYHDIGKMIRPHYFIENQKGINPHDELQPRMSALILISHVKEGIELASEEGLPKAIVDLVPQHHG
ncbi:MAG: HDIG domain-containing protein, partial [Candidatus Latescibacteria bacterium]|nr:HDIG domain-containing protein [Candidatus Latescibacterota bacterium]